MTPSGRPLVPPIWEENHEQGFDAKKKGLLRFRYRLKTFLILTSWAFLIVGVFPQTRVLLALGGGMLIFLHIQHRRCWHASGKISLDLLSYPRELRKGEEVCLDFRLHNRSSQSLSMVIVMLEFLGATKPFQFVMLRHLRPRKSYGIRFRFLSDRSWGEFAVGTTRITVADALGFYECTFEETFTQLVSISPAYSELISGVQVNKASLASHGGVYEMPISGRSVSFLGLRPWVDGDQIKSIDWKRSMRMGELVVKEFEKFGATDATVVFDLCARGHSDFGAISSFQAMRESVIGVIEALFRQQVRTQVYADGIEVPFGKGAGLFAEVSSMILDARMSRENHFIYLLQKAALNIPPDSLVVLCFCSANVGIKDLEPVLLMLSDQRVEVVLMVIDSLGYGRAVKDLADVENMSSSYLFKNYLDAGLRDGTDLQRVMNVVADRTYVLGPGQTIGDVYDGTRGV